MGDPLTEIVHAEVTTALARLESAFVDGMVLTFIAAHPTNPDAHMVVTGAKTLEDVRKTIDETIRSRAEMEVG